MTNRLMRGYIEFRLDEVYFSILKSMQPVYFDFLKMERNRIETTGTWSQFSRIDGLDVIAFIYKYGVITVLQIEYTWQHWFDKGEDPNRYSKLTLDNGDIHSTEYSVGEKEEKEAEFFLEMISKKTPLTIYRTGLMYGGIKTFIFSLLV